MRLTRAAMAATVLLFLAWTGGTAIADDLYQAQTIVTGQREETRAPGVRHAHLLRWPNPPIETHYRRIRPPCSCTHRKPLADPA